MTLDGCSYIQGLCNVVAVTNSKPNGQVHETKTQRGEKKGSHVLQHLHITSQNDPDSQGLQNCSEAVLCLVVLVSAAVPSDLLLCCCLSGFLCSCTVYCFWGFFGVFNTITGPRCVACWWMWDTGTKRCLLHKCCHKCDNTDFLLVFFPSHAAENGLKFGSARAVWELHPFFIRLNISNIFRAL